MSLRDLREAYHGLFNPQGSVMPRPGATLNVRTPPRYQSFAPMPPPPGPAKPDCVQAALDLFEISAQWSAWEKTWAIYDKRDCRNTDSFDGNVPADGYRVSHVLVGANADYDTWMKAITAISTSSQSSEIPADKMKETFGE